MGVWHFIYLWGSLEAFHKYGEPELYRRYDMAYKRNGYNQLTIYLSDEELQQLDDLKRLLFFTGRTEGDRTNAIRWAIKTCYEAHREEYEAIKKKFSVLNEKSTD